MSSESVFIMYSSKDSRQAHEFAEKLIDAGASVWIDTINLRDISGELDEEEVMETALLDAAAVLILTSQNALNDQFVRNDKRFARENDKKMILVTLEACDLSKKMRWRNHKTIKYHENQETAIGEILDLFNFTRKSAAAPEVEDVVSETPAARPEKVKSVTSKSNVQIPDEERAMLNEVKDDIEYYKFKMKEQISKSKMYAYMGIGGAVVIAVAAIFFIPELVTKVSEVQDKIQWAGGLFGGTLPTTFSFSSLNSTKDKKKRLEGVQLFEKKIARYEHGVLPVTKADILALEDDFGIYINA
ncbi:toll/interleukin-1 receptor domain-containing protein [Muriicola soli]|uniref:Toll/interleukin-1 receptor domain-containing protein n=1 Tax=Muriicola soli TaxID=2507538 RepID=A0A411E7V7_9FLAO|nr:toll/interleukin-1 receptor domain-containing protein [Muriicola soli]QBA63815.1 toll/interleukin-1 receptor domain-containing protein [Muriicola soli]